MILTREWFLIRGLRQGRLEPQRFVRNSLQGPFSVLTRELDELHAVGTLWTKGGLPAVGVRRLQIEVGRFC